MNSYLSDSLKEYDLLVDKNGKLYRLENGVIYDCVDQQKVEISKDLTPIHREIYNPTNLFNLQWNNLKDLKEIVLSIIMDYSECLDQIKWKEWKNYKNIEKKTSDF